MRKYQRNLNGGSFYKITGELFKNVTVMKEKIKKPNSPDLKRQKSHKN